MKLSKLFFQDSDLSRLQQNISNVFDYLQLSPLTQPCSIVEFNFASNSIYYDVSHKLGRVPKGYIVVQSDAATTLFGTEPLNSLTASLRASSTANVSILFF